MQHLEGSGTPVLCIGPRFLKVKVVVNIGENILLDAMLIGER